MAVSWIADRTIATPMSFSRSALRQNDTATAIPTRTSVAATSPRVTWIEVLIRAGLSTSVGDAVHQAEAGPGVVDRADLVVDQPSFQRDLPHHVLGQVRFQT